MPPPDKMRLWVDGQCLQTASRMRGIGRYVTEFLRAVSAHQPQVELLVSLNAALPEEALLAREALAGIVPADNIHVWHGTARTGEAIEGLTPERRLSEIALAHHVNCLRPDVALSASPFEGANDPATPLLPNSGCEVPLASIFYDAIPLRFKDTYIRTPGFEAYYMRRLGLHASFASNLSISSFSAREIASIVGASSVSIDAGVSPHFEALVGQKAGEDRPGRDKFFLYVGAFDWRKNVSLIADAFAAGRGTALDKYGFVIAGDGPDLLRQQVRDAWVGNRLDPSRLVDLGHVSDEDLVGLYLRTAGLIQPSLMEGFGLTALEAIRSGTKVVAANTGALPEVVAAESLLFDPRSARQLSDLLVRIVEQDQALAPSFTQAETNAAKFSWHRTAALAIDELGRIAAKPEHNSIASLRSRLAKQLDGLAIEPEAVAQCLALAEPMETPPRLLVDVTQTAGSDYLSGIQRVVLNIASRLASTGGRAGIENRLIASSSGTGWRSVDDITARPAREGDDVVVGRDHLLMLDSSWHLYQQHAYALRACQLRGGHVVTCLYDTVPLYAPAFCDPGMPTVFAQWLSSSLMHSDGIVCISRAVADELVALLEAIEFPREMKVGYWQLGADFADLAPGARRAEDRTGPKRFLMVGTLEPRKGHRVALDAFDRLWRDGEDVELTIVGRVGWNNAHLVKRLKDHPEMGRRLFWRERADDAELAAQYARCDSLVAASFAEGFGLPIVEAGHYGKPVIASDIPVFREVGNGAAGATFFSVGDVQALADAVRDFHRNGGAPTAPPAWPSWDQSAAQLQQVVLGEGWYKTYRPQAFKPFTALSNLGHTSVSSPLATEERRHVIELVEGPHKADEAGAVKIIVSVRNESGRIWSSRGMSDGIGGVALSYHLCDAAGNDVGYDNTRTHIPFVHPPGQTLYLSVLLPRDAKERGASFADIELVQEGISWLGNPLRVRL